MVGGSLRVSEELCDERENVVRKGVFVEMLLEEDC